MRSRRWTESDIAELRRMAEMHLRVSAIARRLDRTVSSVRHKAFLEGISLTEVTLDMLDLP